MKDISWKAARHWSSRLARMHGWVRIGKEPQLFQDAKPVKSWKTHEGKAAMMEQYSDYWISGSAVPGPAYALYWESLGTFGPR